MCGVQDDLKFGKTLEYGKGSVKAWHAVDDFSVGGLPIKQQQFLVAYHTAEFADDGRTVGICGLGFNALSDFTLTFMDNLKEQGVIESREFSIYLSYRKTDGAQTSQLAIGGHNPDLKTEDFTYAKVISSFYWSVRLDSIKMGSVGLDIYADTQRDYSALIDSGTSWLYFEQTTIDLFLKVIKEEPSRRANPSKWAMN